MNIRRILPSLIAVIAVWSMFLPFRVEKPWESFSGNIAFINSMNGFDLFLPSFTLPVFILVAIYALLFKGSRSSNGLVVGVSGLNTLYMALIYIEIRTETGRFDNPEIGAGFFLMTFAAITLLVTSILNYRYSMEDFPDEDRLTHSP